MRTAILMALAAGCTTGSTGETPNDTGNRPGDTGDTATEDTDVDVPECETYGLQPGDCAPNFTLKNTAGVDIELSELRGQRLVVAGSSMW